MKKLQGTQTEKNLLKAFDRESQAKMKYDYFSKQAREEGLIQISEIFTETALNKEKHAKIFFKFLNESSVEIIDTYPASKIGTTLENLKNAAESENYKRTELYLKFARIAKEEGFTDIWITFTMIVKVEKSFEEKFKKLYEILERVRLFETNSKTGWKWLKEKLSIFPDDITLFKTTMTENEIFKSFEALYSTDPEYAQHKMKDAVSDYLKSLNKIPSEGTLGKMRAYNDKIIGDKKLIPLKNVLDEFDNFIKWWETVRSNDREAINTFNQTLTYSYNTTKKWWEDYITKEVLYTAKQVFNNVVEKNWITDFSKWFTDWFDKIQNKYIDTTKKLTENNKVLSKAIDTDSTIKKILTDENVENIGLRAKYWEKWSIVFEKKITPLNDVLKKIKKNWWDDWNKIYTLWRLLEKGY